jgi:6-phosphofructokinase 1
VLSTFRKFNIGYFFYCGGNDSMDTISNLSAYFRSQNEEILCVGIPKTVDNDLVETDHTPGFGSAARFVAASCSEVMIDAMAYPAKSITVVEVMGRNAGWLTASSVLARAHGFTGPHLILLPEVLFDSEKFLDKVADLIKQEDHILVAVSEGIKWKETGKYVSEVDGTVDMFGHSALGGTADVLKTLAQDKLGIKGRSVEPSVLQRVAMHLASGTDLNEARESGAKAVDTALAGKTDVMVCIKRVSNHPYMVRYETAPLADIANKEKKVPAEWICNEGTNVNAKMIEYLRPLFRGESHVRYLDGLPQFFHVDTTAIAKPPIL